MKEIGLQIEGVSQAVCRVDAHDQRPVVERGKFDAGGGGQAGLPCPALAREHEDSHILIIVMARVYEGFYAKRGGEVTTKAMPGLAVSSDPDSPAVDSKIQSADAHPCNREDGCRDIRI